MFYTHRFQFLTTNRKATKEVAIWEYKIEDINFNDSIEYVCHYILLGKLYHKHYAKTTDGTAHAETVIYTECKKYC